jgi:alpha-2-macroglobulin-like protein
VTDEKGEANIEFYNSDALTTFRATLEGIGTTGTAGRSEARYSTQQLLNLSAKAPDKVLTGDVVRIPLSLKNNDNQALTGKLKLVVPSNFEAAGEIPSTVYLAAGEAKTIYLPYKVKAQSANILGESQTFTIDFEAGNVKDRFTTSIKTLSRGFPVTQLFSADKLKNEFAMNLSSPVESTATLKLTAYPNALDDILQGMERMLQQPSGCFEQVSSSNYPNLLVLDLLRNTQQVRPEVEKRALEYLADGYKKLTAYECKSGGFDWWGRDPAHEGLTAYGVLEFTDMARVYNVDKTMIDRTVKWLLSRRNGKGGWTLNPQASHGWQNDNILDTYICYALAEAGYGKEVSSEIEQIYTQVSKQKDAYTQALLANTLFAIGDKKRAKLLINNLLQTQAANGSFTGATHSVFHAYGQGFTIETTALVALALMKSSENESVLAKAIAYIAQSKSEYGYGNTQSTVMALKALCAYTQQQKHEATDGKIVVFANNKRVAEKAYSKSQFGKLQFTGLEQFMTADKNDIKVVFEGTDKAIPFDMELKYASKLPQNAKDSPLEFSTILAQSQAKIGDVVRLSAKLENKTTQAVASPIMLIGIPAGLTAQPWQLKQIVERKECAFYEIFNNYIVFYFDELEAKSLKTIHLDLRSDIGGSYESPASLAYPYYTNEWRVWSQPAGIVVE